MKNLITTTLLVILAVVVVLLSEDLKEQKALIDELVGKHNDHLKFTEAQMDVLIDYGNDIESIYEYLGQKRSFVSHR